MQRKYKKLILILAITALVALIIYLGFLGKKKKSSYLPEATNDHIFVSLP